MLPLWPFLVAWRERDFSGRFIFEGSSHAQGRCRRKYRHQSNQHTIRKRCEAAPNQKTLCRICCVEKLCSRSATATTAAAKSLANTRHTPALLFTVFTNCVANTVFQPTNARSNCAMPKLLIMLSKMVPRAGIEPATRGFSIASIQIISIS